MKSYSQAGQDRFVTAMLGYKTNGRFLDIGCCHPTELSNTYALEDERGWTGLLVDSDPGAIAACERVRKAVCLFADSTSSSFAEFIAGWMAGGIDYLSLDVDGATVQTLFHLPLKQHRAAVATIEHDVYRFGDGPRAAIRTFMAEAGYQLVCADVKNGPEFPFEDWFVDPGQVPEATWRLYLCEGKIWSEIFE